jgi:hypothetical protein
LAGRRAVYNSLRATIKVKLLGRIYRIGMTYLGRTLEMVYWRSTKLLNTITPASTPQE